MRVNLRWMGIGAKKTLMWAILGPFYPGPVHAREHADDRGREKSVGWRGCRVCRGFV